MTRSPRLVCILFMVLALATVALSASHASFCKCTCFSNSTLIQLTGHKSGESGSKDKTENGRLVKAGTCDDCNRQFCMKQELPICKGAEEEDVFTTCFRRDSAKDQLVVFFFIFTTVGLLIWAAIRPWVGQWLESRRRPSYSAVPGETDE